VIKIEETVTYGWEAAIRGMRNPKNSWDKSDSVWCFGRDDDPPCQNCPCYEDEDDGCTTYCNNPDDLPAFVIGDKDMALMKTLGAAGTDHGKYLRMITVTADVTAPFYWWKEYDTYKVGTVANSCSTMHKLTAKEFTMSDFSFEDCDQWTKDVVCSCIINALNMNRNKYLETGDKEVWRQLVQLLPSSYNQKRTVQLNYAVLKNIYHARRNHKLTEWHTFCAWIESLPYSELITE
jgi:hypothetical protein